MARVSTSAPLLFEVDEQALVGHYLEGLLRGEAKPFIDLRKILQQNGEGLARHGTASLKTRPSSEG
jgi:hypothetical protein